mgnify:FL=1
MNRWHAVAIAALSLLSPGTPLAAAPDGSDDAGVSARSPGLRWLEIDLSQDASGQPAAEATPPRWTLSGTADFYFSTNTNDPFTGTNVFRAFDIKDEHGVHFSFLELAAEKRRTPWGARIDVDFGPTARIVNSFEPSDDKFWQYLQQLYVSRNLNGAGTTYLDFGKFVTSAGAEVIEARSNYLYSRGVLFTWAIPFYHFGLRGFHYFNDTDYLTLQVVRGWNAVTDNNDAITLGIGGGRKFGANTIGTLIYYVGPEPDATGGGNTRHLVDVVLTQTVGDRWTFALNGDFARQDSFSFGGGVRQDVDWMGLAGYARYQWTPRNAVTLRGEWFNDSEGAATGVSQNLRSVTLGLSHRLNTYAEARLEWRRDWSNVRVFPESTAGSFGRSQNTILGALVLGF